jgi:hypothetical protein
VLSARKTRSLAAALLAAAACAAVQDPAPAGPSPFRAVKKLVLVRRVDDPKAQRGRDAIDALKESLDARGYETRVVEVGPRADRALRDLDALEDRIAARLWNRDVAPGRVEALGKGAGDVVTRLGADAVAGYHRLDTRFAPLPPPLQPWGAPSTAAQPPPRLPPSGALSLVAADGSLAWFPWGGEAAALDERQLLNPAEAIDAVLAALAGGGGEDW